MTDHTMEEKRNHAVLVGLHASSLSQEENASDATLEELEALLETAGGVCVGSVLQNRETPEARTFIGEGKVAEVAALVQAQGADLVVFDNELSPSQQRVLTEEVGAQVIDRAGLILDIFAARARSSEGRLQVELAQLRYRLPRLAGNSENLSRLGGGIGTRGPGETKLETDRRHIRSRIQKLEEELRDLTRRREQMRSRRKKDGIITAAIVGYTNVGKSTLLNALTDAGVLAENKLFATLDPTARALLLPDGRSVMLIDTVGLVRRLPHNLVEAFKSTLEEAASADVLLCVCDASSPEMDEQIEVTTSLLAELGAADTPMIKVLNKCDLVPGLRPLDRKDTVLISAREKTGFEELLSSIMAALEPSQKRLKLLLPYTAAGLLAEIRQEGKVFSEEYTPDGILADALVHIRVLHKVAPYQIS